MSTKLNQQGLDYVQKSGSALQAAAGLLEATEKEKQASAELIPGVIERLASLGFLADHQKQACTLQLGNPREAMEILGNVLDVAAEKIAEAKQAVAVKTASDMGSPSDETSGGTTGGIDKYANQPGFRRGNDDPLAESDAALFSGLGLAVPQR